MKRFILIVLDSVGIGALPDAALYGDEGSNTIGNIVKTVGLDVPNMVSLGLSNIDSSLGLPKCDNPLGAYGRLAEASPGKDTTTGHWEIAGIRLNQPFPTYPHGFPDEVIQKLRQSIGRDILGNEVASGTEIINRLGDEHVRTGYPIVYTSADSVLQIAAHENVIPPSELYEICQKAREIMTGEHAVGRIIARPFDGENGHYIRTKNRRDFSLEPMGITILDLVKEAGMDVMAVGKIEDIFAYRGITKSNHAAGNPACIDATLEFIKSKNKGLIFSNLVDFDMLYGHRNDMTGYKEALEYFDKRLPEIINAMNEDDILLITADHGCDPTTASTDHSREYIPFLAYGKTVKPGAQIGTRNTFADIAATIAEGLGLKHNFNAKSFYNDIIL